MATTVLPVTATSTAWPEPAILTGQSRPEGFLKHIKSKRCIAEGQRIFIRKAFLGQAATLPSQASSRMKDAEVRKDGAGEGEICWLLGDMPQLRHDVEQSTTGYEHASTAGRLGHVRQAPHATTSRGTRTTSRWDVPIVRGSTCK
jgi:hypothetical protein